MESHKIHVPNRQAAWRNHLQTCKGIELHDWVSHVNRRGWDIGWGILMDHRLGGTAKFNKENQRKLGLELQNLFYAPPKKQYTGQIE